LDDLTATNEVEQTFGVTPNDRAKKTVIDISEDEQRSVFDTESP
jgi:hypothetical protein